MINYGRYERSTCYWVRYVSLSGVEKTLHVDRDEIILWAQRNLGILDWPSELNSFPARVLVRFFAWRIKQQSDSLTFDPKTARMKHGTPGSTRVKSPAPSETRGGK